MTTPADFYKKNFKITTNTHCLTCGKKSKLVMCAKCAKKHEAKKSPTPSENDELEDLIISCVNHGDDVHTIVELIRKAGWVKVDRVELAKCLHFYSPELVIYSWEDSPKYEKKRWLKQADAILKYLEVK
jgi:hypothetical protein